MEPALGPVEFLKSWIFSECAQYIYTTKIRFFLNSEFLRDFCLYLLVDVKQALGPVEILKSLQKPATFWIYQVQLLKFWIVAQKNWGFLRIFGMYPS